MTVMRLNIILILLVGLLLLLQYRLWFESDGIRDMLRFKKSMALQAEQNEQLKKRNHELLFQIQRLQHSQDAAESRARNELGMIKEGETYYQIVK